MVGVATRGYQVKVSLVISFISQYKYLLRTIEVAKQNAGADFELVLIDNGSIEPRDIECDNLVRNDFNTGVVQPYRQGFDESVGGIIFYIHSDVLLHESNWVDKLTATFEVDPKIGCVGLFGASGIGIDGGRLDPFSNMLGREWGGCRCHNSTALHHGRLITETTPAVVLDGLGMAFTREAMSLLITDTDMFEESRSRHHFYDKIMPLKVISLGYRVAVTPLAFDHLGGVTSGQLDCNEDQALFDLAKQQMFTEFGNQFPITVDSGYNYTSEGLKWP